MSVRSRTFARGAASSFEYPFPHKLAASGKSACLQLFRFSVYASAKESHVTTLTPSMATHKLENYLRTYRRRSGLTQRELAFLLGWETETQVSRYEKRHRLPPLATALACEEVFGVPAAELFAGVRESAVKTMRKRMVELRSKLQDTGGAAQTKSEARLTEQKLRWLAARGGAEFVKQVQTP